MTQIEERKIQREADDKWTTKKLITLAFATIAFALTTIYIISGFNGGH